MASSATLSRPLSRVPRTARIRHLIRLCVGPTATVLAAVDLAGQRYSVLVSYRRPHSRERAAVVIDPPLGRRTAPLVLSEVRRALRLRGLQAGHEGRRVDALWWAEMAERV